VGDALSVNSFKTSLMKPVQRHPGLLLQPFKGAEAGPVLPLEFQILSIG
jgi:hypothetical protein